MLFNYQPEQWQAILRRVPRPREFDCSALLVAANTYLDDAWPPPDERARMFRRIIELQLELRLAVGVASATYFDEAHALPPELFKQLDAVTHELERRSQDALDDVEFGWSPKEIFFREVFDLWGAAGGEFKRSRPADRGGAAPRIPSGPLIEYFEAVVQPVMGDKAPGRETIYKLIPKHKGEDAELERLAAELERPTR